MQTFDLLLTISQLSVGLAGFSAIVITLNPRPIREWSASDRVALRILVQVSFVTMIFSLLPFVLGVSLASEVVWFYGLWVYGVVHLIDVSTFIFRRPSGMHISFKVNGALGFIIACLQIVVAAFGDSTAHETTYTAALLWHLYVLFAAFVLLLYHMRQTDGGS
jgi:hypothetical protein